MKNASTWIAGGMLCVALSGCVTVTGSVQNYMDDMIYSAKCVGTNDTDACKLKARQDFEDSQNPKRGNPATIASTSATPINSDPNNYQERCEPVQASGPIDVDTAYIRAMNAYHFMTFEERQLIGDALPGFTHARTPGVRYDISTTVNSLPGYGNAGRAHVNLVLYKSESGKGTHMEATYCISTSNLKPNPHFNNNAFWSDVSAGFRKLVQK